MFRVLIRLQIAFGLIGAIFFEIFETIYPHIYETDMVEFVLIPHVF